MNNLEAYKGVFVFAQQVDNVISNIAFELIGKGKELAKDLGVEVTAVLVGSDVKGLADQLAVRCRQGYRCRRSGVKRVPYRAVHTCNRICYRRVQTGNLPDRCYCNRS